MAGRAPAAWETRRPLLPELALVAATSAYGSTFKLVQNALVDITPLGYILLRFAVASVALLPFAVAGGWRNREPGAPRTTDDLTTFLRIGFVFGVIGFVGYWFQNEALQHTTTSDSAFITGLFVVFTPIIETIARRRRPARLVTVAIAISLVGLFLLTGARLDIGYGNALTLGCAAFFGLWIYVGGQLANRFDPVALTCVQMAVMSALALPLTAATGFGHATGRVWLAVLVTGVVCSAVAFTVQLWGQRRIEPARAAVILLFEPVVAGFVGYAVGERLGVHGYVGAVLILVSILVAEAPSWISSARAAAAR